MLNTLLNDVLTYSLLSPLSYSWSEVIPPRNLSHRLRDLLPLPTSHHHRRLHPHPHPRHRQCYKAPLHMSLLTISRLESLTIPPGTCSYSSQRTHGVHPARGAHTASTPPSSRRTHGVHSTQLAAYTQLATHTRRPIHNYSGVIQPMRAVIKNERSFLEV